MSQNRKALVESLAALRRQLDETPSIEPALAERLKSALAEVETELAGRETSAGPRAGLIARLSAAAHDFEDSHPTLSGTVASLVDALAGMGI